MKYSTINTTKRAKESPLWGDLSKQQGKSLPYLLERYLLLENWKYVERITDEGALDHSVHDIMYDINYVHLLLADAVTVLLSQEERIRVLESHVDQLASKLDESVRRPA